MSAGFKVRDTICWGTNGAVETYVEVLAREAAHRLGAEDALAVYLRECHEGFYSGFIVFFDDWTRDAAGRRRVIDLFDHATEDILRRRAFTEHGESWVDTDVRPFIAELATSPHMG